MDKWFDDNGNLILSVGVSIGPNGQYIIYKLFPRLHKNYSQKPRVEYCKGMLLRNYEEEDQYLLLHTKVMDSFESDNEKEVYDHISQNVLSTVLSGWVLLTPASPMLLLRTPWKRIDKIKV